MHHNLLLAWLAAFQMNKAQTKKVANQTIDIIYYVPGIGNQLGTFDAVWGVHVESLTPAPLKCQRADLEVAGQETSERLIEL